MKKLSAICVLTTTAFLTMPVAAEGLYGDVGLGLSDLNKDRVDASDVYIRAGLGIELTSQLSAEAGLWDLGNDSDHGVKIAAKALYTGLRLHTDITPKIQIYGKLGLTLWDTDVGDDNDNGIDLYLTGGVGTPVGPGLASVEANFMDLGGVDVTTFGFAYRLPIVF